MSPHDRSTSHLDQLEEIMADRTGQATAKVLTARLDLAVEGDDELSGPQREVASAVAGRRELVLVVGPAGAGKTTALGRAIEQLLAQGRAVFGVAPSAATAEVLAHDAGLASDTPDKLLVEHRLQRPPDHRYDLPTGATVVVDQAAMVPTPRLAGLAELAEHRRWRLVLVGDPLQFSAVGRSGMLGHLIDRYGAIELDRVHRFAHAWEREASLQLRRGNPDVLAVYDDHGRIHGGSRRQMERAVVNAWWEARSQGERAAMMAPTNETVVALNHRAQAIRARAGEVDLAGPSVEAASYRLHVGDAVPTPPNDRGLRTDYRLMVKNRDQWEVKAVHHDGALSVAGRTGTVRLPADYVAEHVELAYAQTIHATQGRTVDRAFLFLDGPADTQGVPRPAPRQHAAHEQPRVIGLVGYEAAAAERQRSIDVAVEQALLSTVPARMPQAAPPRRREMLGAVPHVLAAAVVLGVYLGLPLTLAARDLLGALGNAVLLAVAVLVLVGVTILAVLRATSRTVSSVLSEGAPAPASFRRVPAPSR